MDQVGVGNQNKSMLTQHSELTHTEQQEEENGHRDLRGSV